MGSPNPHTNKNNAGNGRETQGNTILNTHPRYSVVTPTILRSTLKRLCDSIDNQTEQDYEHIIIVDFDQRRAPEGTLLRFGMCPPETEKRKYYWCDKSHMNCGNTCRHNATKLAKGDYIFYIDDDDYLADNQVLQTLNMVTLDWAIFPVSTCGRVIYSDPPGMCRTTTGGFLLKRGLIDWPDVPNYETDGMIVQELLQRGIPYQALPERSLTIHPAWNVGRYI